MDKLRTVRGVHDLLPAVINKHNKVITEGLKIGEPAGKDGSSGVGPVN